MSVLHYGLSSEIMRRWFNLDLRQQSHWKSIRVGHLHTVLNGLLFEMTKMIIGLKNFEFMDCIRVICHVWTFQCYSNSYEVISKFGDDTYSNLTCGETKLVFGSKTIVSESGTNLVCLDEILTFNSYNSSLMSFIIKLNQFYLTKLQQPLHSIILLWLSFDEK